ncbi:uncharacterized protein Z520_00127 [Fonsecaea multimorphosa CBS 102226]|uniref:Uncharacterized protein n=1 Tax=Fonsecaea multimorphosa CBS 102226 TaxID=1442371 RepID=A0A0D2HNQ7_9EURO|nr:uncharacterized protein Z520_00127 [Fonsecaea multimorphosa CBS 102226]KIY03436.1 hypothetical protein Z520_00127 [Fonsecaea multimorphosa CBS 102226]OAL32842.1 hypothetical protein AYO22_00168 [Fonsecaea multimorphosa]
MDESFSQPPEPREDRGPRIPPAKLSTIKPDPTISLFFKPTKTSPLVLVDSKFSRDAAMIFCDRIRHDLMDNNSKSFTIVGGNLNGLKEVVAWIKQCVAEQSIVKFKDLEDDAPDLFTTYVNVIISAYYLGIPPRDLSDHILKRMSGIARKRLMSWDEVEWFYTTPLLAVLPNDKEKAVREVAATSVFWAWWNGKLDENETPEEMMTLSVLRQENSKLDQDLHDWCERNEAEVRKKWEEKDKAKKSGGLANGHHDENGHAVGSASGGGDGGGGDEATTVASPETKNWDTFSGEGPLGPPNSVATQDSGIGMGVGGKNIPSVPPTLPAVNEMDSINGAGDWAEEVSEVTRLNNQQW